MDFRHVYGICNVVGYRWLAALPPFMHVSLQRCVHVVMIKEEVVFICFTVPL